MLPLFYEIRLFYSMGHNPPVLPGPAKMSIEFTYQKELTPLLPSVADTKPITSSELVFADTTQTLRQRYAEPQERSWLSSTNHSNTFPGSPKPHSIWMWSCDSFLANRIWGQGCWANVWRIFCFFNKGSKVTALLCLPPFLLSFIEDVRSK